MKIFYCYNKLATLTNSFIFFEWLGKFQNFCSVLRRLVLNWVHTTELAMDCHTAQCNRLWYELQTLDAEDFCRCKHKTEFSGSQSLNAIPAGSEASSDYDSEQEECTQYKIVAKIKSKGNESKTAKCWNLKRDLHKAVPRSGKSVTSRNWLLFAKRWFLEQEITIILGK